jgi:hypothetical protein
MMMILLRARALDPSVRGIEDGALRGIGYG